jgi:hypothetical protein
MGHDQVFLQKTASHIIGEIAAWLSRNMHKYTINIYIYMVNQWSTSGQSMVNWSTSGQSGSGCPSTVQVFGQG